MQRATEMITLRRASHAARRRLAAVVALALTYLALGAQQEFDTLPTAAYGIFPVQGSSVHGQIQISGTAEGGTRIVLSVTGLDAAELRRAAIYVGSCGPDRELLLELVPLGSIASDPFVSITESDISFETITEGEHFVYVFAGDGIDTPEVEGFDLQPLACGEVGVGAIA